MELRDYLGIARRRWLLILGTTLVVVGIAALITTQLTKQYASTARVFISTTSSDSSDAFQGSQFSQQRIASYADVVSGLELSQRVIDSLGLDTKATTLSEKIQASVVPDTVVLKITVTDASPRQAQAINKGVVSQLQGFVAELETPPGKTVPLLKATVVDTPRLPESPVSPQPVRNLALGLVLGLLLGFGIAVLREVLDTSVRRVEDVAALSQTPLLSSLAFDDDVHDHPLISTLAPHAPRAEAFRVLRTNLSFLDVDHTSRAFVVTSSVPGEGKSTTAVNAAIAMANAGQRVLLIDGDLRRPQVAKMLGLEGTVGLTTTLIGQLDLDAVIQQHAPSNLHVVTAGRLPPNPAELLQSRAMSDLLTEVRRRYEVVVIDSPPLLPVTDAAVVASMTDGAVVVVRFGKTTKEQVTGAIERLRSVESTPLGAILNMVPAGRSGNYGYGYGYTYGYGPQEEPEAPPEKRDKKSKKKDAESTGLNV